MCKQNKFIWLIFYYLSLNCMEKFLRVFYKLKQNYTNAITKLTWRKIYEINNISRIFSVDVFHEAFSVPNNKLSSDQAVASFQPKYSHIDSLNTKQNNNHTHCFHTNHCWITAHSQSRTIFTCIFTKESVACKHQQASDTTLVLETRSS